MKITPAQIAIAFVAMVIGFAITLQMKSVKKNDALAPPNLQRVEILTSELFKEKEKYEDLYKKYIECTNNLSEFQRQAATDSDYSGILAKQLEQAEIIAGLVDVEGPGIIFTLDDSKSHTNIDPLFADYYVVHDSDLLMVINELRDAGAEAISINGERILSTSEIRCAGSVVSVNNNRHSAPFEIRAIGDPEQLESALRMRGGIMDTLKMSDIEMSIKKSNKLKILRYAGAINFKYVDIVTKEGE